MIEVNNIEIRTEHPLMEIRYNMGQDAVKEYKWSEVALILSRIPRNYGVLYESGSIWNTSNDTRYVFDTFSQTKLKDLTQELEEGEVNEYLFNVSGDYSFTSLKQFINDLNTLFAEVSERDLIVEYLNLVLVKRVSIGGVD